MNITTNISIIDKLDTISLAIEGLKEIGKIIFTMAKIIGVIKPDMDIQEIGDKAIQAEKDGISPDKYDNYSDYVSALENYDVNPEESQKISEELKEMKGVEIAIGLIVEKLADTQIVQFLESVFENPTYFENGKIEEFSEIINEDKGFITDYIEYVSGCEKDTEKINCVIEKLVAVEKKVNPEISEKEAYKNVTQLRR